MCIYIHTAHTHTFIRSRAHNRIIANGHRPYANIERAMGDLFVKYGVDVYFAGHKHSYARSGPTTKEGEYVHPHLEEFSSRIALLGMLWCPACHCSVLCSVGFRLDKKAMLSETHYHLNEASGPMYVIIGSAGCDEMDYVYEPHTGAIRSHANAHSVSVVRLWSVFVCL